MNNEFLTVRNTELSLQGVVSIDNYANYLNNAIMKYLRKLNINFEEIFKQNITFLPISINYQFESQLVLDDEYKVLTVMCIEKNLTLKFTQEVIKSHNNIESLVLKSDSLYQFKNDNQHTFIPDSLKSFKSL